VHPVGKSSPVAGAANVHTPAQGHSGRRRGDRDRAECAANGGENLAARQGLALRHLEPLLQVLAPHGILTGYRGPRGGYRLAREPSDISVEDILRSVGSMEDDSTRSLLPIGHC
jgi:hypothetical protein